MNGIGNIIDIVPPPTPYNFKYKNQPLRELDLLPILLPYAENEFDFEYLYRTFGCTHYNAEHPQKILQACEVLSDYRFGDLFEEVAVDYSQTFPCSSLDCWCAKRMDDGWFMGHSKVGNVHGIDYLILTTDNMLLVSNDRCRYIFIEEGTRIFKLKDDYVDVTHDLKICGEKCWTCGGHTLPKQFPYIECLRDVVCDICEVYYHNMAINDIIKDVVLKFVPSDAVESGEGEKKYVLSLRGLMTYRYNEVC